MGQFIDLTGQKFGRLTVIEFHHKQKQKNVSRTFWLCRCECGNTFVRRSDYLKNIKDTPCPNCPNERNLVGQKFGKLTVLEFAERDKQGKARWLCICECGNKTVVDGYHLKSGHIKSCGCLKNIGHNIKHGMSFTRLNNIWRGMRIRCNNDARKSFKYYGGRGIKVCEEWDDFQAFYDWSMQNGYTDELTIDRIDYNGDYCPENCRWVTVLEQANNKRNNHYITYNGKTQTIAQWSRELNIDYGTLQRRINSGWTIEKALETPVKAQN